MKKRTLTGDHRYLNGPYIYIGCYYYVSPLCSVLEWVFHINGFFIMVSSYIGFILVHKLASFRHVINIS